MEHLRIGSFLELTLVYGEDLSELGSIVSFTVVNDDAHDTILVQVLHLCVPLELAIFHLFVKIGLVWFELYVVNWVLPFSLQVPILRYHDPSGKILDPHFLLFMRKASKQAALFLTILRD